MTRISSQTYIKPHFPLTACHPDSPPPSPTSRVPLSLVTWLQPKAPPDSDEEIDLSLEAVEDLRGEIRTAAALALRSVENFTLKRLRSVPKTTLSSFKARMSVAGTAWKVPKKRDLEDYWRKEQHYGPTRRGRSVSPQKQLRLNRPFAFIGDTGRTSCSPIETERLLRRRSRTRNISDIPAPEPGNCAY